MNPLLEFLLQLFLVREIEGVFSGVDVCVRWKRQLDESVLLLFAEENSDGWFLPFLLYMSVVVVYVHLHLTKILMSEFVNLEINEDIALKKTVIEY